MLFTEDATHYADQIKAGHISIKEIVERALDNIATHQHALNAVTHLQGDSARRQALDYDNKLAQLSPEEKEALPPFYGVPILLKDLGHDQAGQPAERGARLLKGNIAKSTANFTQTLEEAGFIVIGRTNVPEFGLKTLSDSDLHGPVNAPFASSRNAGGSSGGAAAAVKAGLVPIATASDGGGSIRVPASFNGLIGLKPSRGRTAVGPGAYRSWQGAAVGFAVTRSVRDTWKLLKTLQVEQYEAPFVMPKIQEEELKGLDRPLKIGWFTASPLGTKINSEVKESMVYVKEKLEQLGHNLSELELDIDGIQALRSYFIMNCAETAVTLEDIEQAKGRPLQMEDMDPYTWAVFKAGQNIPATIYSRMLAYWDQMTAYLEGVFEEYDLILSPTTNGPAMVHGTTVDDKEWAQEKLKDIEAYPFEDQLDIIYDTFLPGTAYTPYSQQANLTGTPAISLPLFETEEGFPIGSQFWTNKGNEYLLLQLAKQLEESQLLQTQVFDLDKQR